MSTARKTIDVVPESRVEPATPPVTSPAAAAPAPAAVPPKAPPRWRRRALMFGLPVLLAAGGGYVWITGGRYISTDNAYVQQPLVTVSADVAGRITEVDVAQNQEVVAGQPLFRIDPEPYRIAVDQAESSLAAARQQVDQLRAAYSTAQAKLEAAKGIVEVRNRELDRERSLAEQGVTAAETVDEATLAARTAENEVALARAGLAAAAAALGGNADVATDDVPAVKTALAQLAAARQQVEQLRAAYASAQAQLQAAQSVLEVRQRELGRQQSLANTGVSASASLDEATLAAQTAQNEVAMARAALNSAAAALGGDPDVTTDEVPAVRTALAQLDAARQSVEQLRAAYASAQARLDAGQAIVAVRDRELERQTSLAQQGVAAATALDQATLAARAAQNDVVLAQEGLDATVAALGGDPDIATDDVPAVRVALAQRDAAARALDQTLVVAPAAGLVAQIESLNVGQYVAPGTMVASLVEAGDTWVEANFKETQLATLQVGQPVDVEIDAYPDLEIHGTVDSLGAATGSQLSLLPAQNATGNWVKVVQRLPVRIRIEGDAAHLLRGGMSAQVSVDSGRSRLDGLR